MRFVGRLLLGVAGLLALVGFVGWLCLSVLLLLVVMVAAAVVYVWSSRRGSWDWDALPPASTKV